MADRNWKKPYTETSDGKAAEERERQRGEVYKTFERWIEKGHQICVFENHDLGHAELGRRFAIGVDPEIAVQLVLGQSRGPDTQQFGLGWRYVLIARTLDPEVATALIYKPGEPFSEGRWGEPDHRKADA